MVKIISDSTRDLSKELLEKYEVSILPLHILLGEQEYEDGVDIDPDTIYRWSDENKTTPKTSAPSIERAVGLMKPFLEQLGIFEEILETRAGGVISSHCGPGTLGVLYIDQKQS
jgi:fatty acid-binding protein DegV